MNFISKIQKTLINLGHSRNVYEGFNSIGKSVKIGRDPVFQYKERIDIGNYVYIGNRAFMNGRGEIEVGDYSIISDDVVILSVQHNYKDANLLPYDQIEVMQKVSIGRCCWIGLRAILLPGVIIEEGCIIGAGAVVTKSFPMGSIIAGNPAVIIGQRDIKKYKQLVEEERFYLVIKEEENLLKVEKFEKVKRIEKTE